MKRWREDRAKALQNAKKEYSSWVSSVEASRAVHHSRLVHEHRALALREQVDLQRAEHMTKLKEKQREKDREDREQKEKDKIEQEKQRKYQSDQRARAELWKEAKIELQHLEAEAERQREEQRKAEALAEAPFHAARVSHRREVERMKELERAAKLEAQETARLQKQARIAAALTKLRDRVQVEADPERLQQRPKHWDNEQGEQPLPKELFSRHGFSVECLMRDKRYRLGAAMFEAGLYQSQSAQLALKQLIPTQKQDNTKLL